MSINAALIAISALQDDEAAAQGDQAAMTEVVLDASRHILSTAITTFGGFLPLIQGGVAASGPVVTASRFVRSAPATAAEAALDSVDLA